MQEEVNLNFYKVLDEEDTDPRRKEVRRIINIYKTPPPIPKRVDSVAKNIDQYFRQDLVKQAEKDDIVQDIEREILNFSPDDEFLSAEESQGETHPELSPSGTGSASVFPDIPTPPPLEYDREAEHIAPSNGKNSQRATSPVVKTGNSGGNPAGTACSDAPNGTKRALHL